MQKLSVAKAKAMRSKSSAYWKVLFHAEIARDGEEHRVERECPTHTHADCKGPVCAGLAVARGTDEIAEALQLAGEFGEIAPAAEASAG